MRPILLGLTACLTLASTTAASAIVAYDGGPGHLTNPTNQTSFEFFTDTVNPANVPFIEDGIELTFVSASNQGRVVSWKPYTGDGAWEAAGPGEYTRIRMTNGSLMKEVQWKSRSDGGQDVIYWQALRNGTLVQPMNHFLSIGGAYRNFGLEATTEFEQFDELRLVVTSGEPFGVNQFQAFYMDDLSVSTVMPPAPPAGVPEPSGWAILLAGFGLAGAAMRTRRCLRHRTTR